MKTYLVVWFSGMIAGLVLILRWQRMGSSALPATGNAQGDVASDASSAVPQSPADQPKVTTVIVTGAKADVERARHLYNKVAPWRNDPAPSPTTNGSPAAASA